MLNIVLLARVIMDIMVLVIDKLVKIDFDTNVVVPFIAFGQILLIEALPLTAFLTSSYRYLRKQKMRDQDIEE